MDTVKDLKQKLLDDYLGSINMTMDEYLGSSVQTQKDIDGKAGFEIIN